MTERDIGIWFAQEVFRLPSTEQQIQIQFFQYNIKVVSSDYLNWLLLKFLKSLWQFLE